MSASVGNNYQESTEWLMKKGKDYKSLDGIECWHFACCKLWRECSYYYCCIFKIIIYQLNNLITTKNVHINSVPMPISTRETENMNRKEQKSRTVMQSKNELFFLSIITCYIAEQNIRICSFERTPTGSVHDAWRNQLTHLVVVVVESKNGFISVKW